MKYALGMDVGGTRTKLGLAELEAGVVKDTIVYPTEKKEIDFLRLLSYHVAEITHSANKSDITGIGAAISGYIHRDTRRIDEASGNFIPFFASYPIEGKLEKLLGMPCKAENDAAIVCYGEALYGAGKNYERVLMLTLGTGVGVGFVAH